MSESNSTEKKKLEKMTQEFVDTSNRADLDATMKFFSEDAVFEDIYGGSHAGIAAIREGLMPFFDGSLGKITYVGEDTFYDVDEQKVMLRWRCNMALDGKLSYLRGLDLLHFRDDKLIAKLAYGKASEPMIKSDS